jgi:hypothetical protein
MKFVTIATVAIRPKSLGRRSRDKIAVEASWRTKRTPWHARVMPLLARSFENSDLTGGGSAGADLSTPPQVAVWKHIRIVGSSKKTDPAVRFSRG